jgi:ssDNA-binding Zn-finger/Zn-ribbon topoisomerase 1
MKTHIIKCPNCDKGKIKIKVYKSNEDGFNFDIFSCNKCNHDLTGKEIEKLFHPKTNEFLYEIK